MKKILIKNCTLISMDETKEKIQKNMDILIIDSDISKISKNIEIEEKEDIKIINAEERIVMPGFINTHSHVGMSIFRETLDGYTLQDWLEKKIWPIEDTLTPENMYYATMISFLEMIKTGTTTINDMYFFPEEIIKAMEETGIRLQTTRTLMDVQGEKAGQERLEILENLIKKYHENKKTKKEHKTLSLNSGVHSFYTCSDKYVDKCIEISNKYEVNVHMHFCENSQEVKDIEKIYGKKPIDVLKEKANKLNKNLKIVLAHCVKLSKEEIDELAKLNVDISHCPISNLKLGCGIANISYMIEKGINVSLGTDGQGTGCSLDMFDTMKFTNLLQKGITEEPKKLPAYDVLKMATINGAKALGLEKEIGSIEEGKKADIIIIDLNTITMKPCNNILAELVNNAKGSNVMTTIVNGKILMEDRKLQINIDEEKIFNKCKNILEIQNN